jgi:prepilin-type N-terminal cleavage/methylation domain-containing protein
MYRISASSSKSFWNRPLQTVSQRVAARRLRRRSGGFTFIELIVGLAIMTMIAAVVTPVLVGTLDKARIEEARHSLENLAEGIVNFEDDVREYPGHLTQLYDPISSSDRDICGQTYNGGDVNRWEGTYIDRIVPPSGLPVFIGSAQNQLTRISFGVTVLLITVSGVTEDDAIALNEIVDDDGNSLAGTIVWLPTGSNDMVTLYYTIPINGC